MKALLIVDLQNDFCPEGALAVPAGDEVVPVANLISPLFPLVLATKDWHPSNHGSFAVNHPGRSTYEVGELAGLPQVLWPVHCVQNSHGAKFHQSFDVSRVSRVFLKGTDPDIDSYSAFYDNARRKATGLAEYLQDKGVTHLTVMGLATDYCVRATTLDGLWLGFSMTIVRDGCRAVNLTPSDGLETLKVLEEAGAQIVDSESLIHHS
jgi:nicotinamidase/pyrazinamidase